MSVDATAYIEWREPSEPFWHGEKVWVGGHPLVFDALAGGKSGQGFLYSPRGLPQDVSDIVLRRACYRLRDPADPVNPEEKSKPRSESSGPPWVEIIRREGVDYEYCPIGWIHSHSWLTPAEIDASLRHRNLNRDSLSEGWSLTRSRMSELEASGHQVRLIIWFDGGPVESPRFQVVERLNAVFHKDWRPIHAAGGVTGVNDYWKFVSPVFRILNGSRSELELVNLLQKTEREDLRLPVSDPDRLRDVARKLLALDVSF